MVHRRCTGDESRDARGLHRHRLHCGPCARGRRCDGSHECFANHCVGCCGTVSQMTTEQIQQWVMASLIGVVAVGAARLVHRRQPLSPYLLLGATPGSTTVAWLLILSL